MPGVVLSAAPQHNIFHRQLIQQRQQQQQFNFNSNKIIPYIPPEIIRIILDLLKDDKKTLAKCALVNHTFNLHVTPILYQSVSFSFPFTFNLFSKTINGETQRTRLIRHLDLSGFSTIGLQKSDSVTKKEVITSELLIPILRSCAMLEAFSISETLESTITLEVLKVLLFEMKNLKILDFCGSSSKQFGSAFNILTKILGQVKIFQSYDENDLLNYSFEKINNNNVDLSNIQRISFHECTTISEISIITLLSYMKNLTHLDLGGCHISDFTLSFIANETNIPKTLTHLLLSKCKNISSEEISNLIFNCENLQVVNLRDITTAINEYDLIQILSSPSSKNFRIFDIGGSNITQNILYKIQENCSDNLQYLGIAKANIRNISNLLDFINSIPNLKYIDLSDVKISTATSNLTSLNMTSLLKHLKSDHSLYVIEINNYLFNYLSNSINNGWKKFENCNSNRRRYYSKNCERPDKVHALKLDLVERGSERMSKIFQYYSFNV